MSIERVGVVGCGLMGSGIAEVCARAGRDVVIREIDPPTALAAQQRIENSLARAAKRGKLSTEEVEAALGRIRFSSDYTDFQDRQLVIEAIVESEPEKLEVFASLDEVVGTEDTILASNTSSIPVMKLAMVTRRPHAVCGLHFFNPVPVLKLVELVVSLLTSEETAQRASAFASDVLRAGFIVNQLLIPYLLSAIRMVESGFATKDDIDTGMVMGCNHPMGPLALLDLIGLDTTLSVAESLYEEFREQLYAPPPLLSRMVEAGLLGRKTGRGFFDYRK
jgi:3-hydroxybutyryl-CoA dehydrogenase